MTGRQKIAVACAVLVLGTGVAWCAAAMSAPRVPEPGIAPEIQVAYVDLSDESLAKIEDIINGR